MIYKVPNTEIIFDLRENYLTDEIVIREIWEEDVYRIEKDMLKNSIVVDVGANIGSFSIYSAFYGATVYAVEPEPHNLQALIKNVELNNMNDKINIIDYGISDYDGIAVISDNGGGATIKDNLPGSEINILSFDSFLKKYSLNFIDILKIDIEGSEKELILGASKESMNKCKYITMEFDIRVGKYLGDIVQKMSETHHVRTMGSWERGGMIWGWLY